MRMGQSRIDNMQAFTNIQELPVWRCATRMGWEAHQTGSWPCCPAATFLANDLPLAEPTREHGSPQPPAYRILAVSLPRFRPQADQRYYSAWSYVCTVTGTRLAGWTLSNHPQFFHHELHHGANTKVIWTCSNPLDTRHLDPCSHKIWSTTYTEYHFPSLAHLIWSFPINHYLHPRPPHPQTKKKSPKKNQKRQLKRKAGGQSVGGSRAVSERVFPQPES